MKFAHSPENVIGRGKFLISADYLDALVAFSARYGVSCEFLFLDLDVSLHEYLARPKFVRNDTYNALIDRLISVTDDPFLSWHYGKILSEHSHGSIGLALRSCKTLQQFYEILPTFFATRVGYAQSILTRINGNAMELCLRSSAPAAPSHIVQFNTISGLIGLVWLIRTLTGTENTEIHEQLHVVWPELEKTIPAGLLPKGMSVLFNQKENLIATRRSQLNSKILSSSPKLKEAALQQAELEQGTPPPKAKAVEKVQWALRVMYPHIPTLEEAAERIRMSPATLKRHLRDMNTSYSTLKGDARFEHAESLLLLTDQSLEEIAQQIGFSDASNFSKAFRRRFDETPGAFRRRHNALNDLK